MKVKTEIVAGATTFFTMSYILANLLEPITFFTNIFFKFKIRHYIYTLKARNL